MDTEKNSCGEDCVGGCAATREPHRKHRDLLGRPMPSGCDGWRCDGTGPAHFPKPGQPAEGFRLSCPEPGCAFWCSLSENAHAHRLETKHGPPVVERVPEGKPKVPVEWKTIDPRNSYSRASVGGLRLEVWGVVNGGPWRGSVFVDACPTEASAKSLAEEIAESSELVGLHRRACRDHRDGKLTNHELLSVVDPYEGSDGVLVAPSCSVYPDPRDSRIEKLEREVDRLRRVVDSTEVLLARACSRLREFARVHCGDRCSELDHTGMCVSVEPFVRELQDRIRIVASAEVRGQSHDRHDRRCVGTCSAHEGGGVPHRYCGFGGWACDGSGPLHRGGPA